MNKVFNSLVVTAMLLMACSDTVNLSDEETQAQNQQLNMDNQNTTNQQTSVENTNTPQACRNGPSSILTACHYEEINRCFEYSPGVYQAQEIDSACLNDGGQILRTCSETQKQAIGVCNEGDRFVVFYERNEELLDSSGCNLDGFEWISCTP